MDSTTKPSRPPFAGRPADSEFVLHVIQGADAGNTFRLDGNCPSRVYVGQAGSCDVRLADPRVSRRHAALDLQGTHLMVTDLESRNGTFVNGVLLVQARLTGGEILKLGDSALRLDFVQGTHARPLGTADRFGRVVGASIEMRRLYTVLERLARSSAPVLIEGEPGTGKDLVAETLHEAGAQSAGPFVLLDASQRDAHAAPVVDGLVQQASGGTLVIDEIASLSFAGQTALLSALRAAREVRAIAMSRRDVEQEAQAGRFRADLLSLFDTGRIELPPLRRRDGDVAYLARHFWELFGGEPDAFPFDLLETATLQSWPANVRELEVTVAQRRAGATAAALLTRGSAPPPADSRDPIANILELDLPFIEARELAAREFERRYLERALLKENGNVLRAAAASGVGRRYFHKLRAKMRRPG